MNGLDAFSVHVPSTSDVPYADKRVVVVVADDDEEKSFLLFFITNAPRWWFFIAAAEEDDDVEAQRQLRCIFYPFATL